jgi:Kef-type K+ transport system membrane component KefB
MVWLCLFPKHLAYEALRMSLSASNFLCAVLLQRLAFADTAISSIRSWDEAIVIAVALSLSSSAFVLQLLGDKGQLASRCGSLAKFLV